MNTAPISSVAPLANSSAEAGLVHGFAINTKLNVATKEIESNGKKFILSVAINNTNSKDLTAKLAKYDEARCKQYADIGAAMKLGEIRHPGKPEARKLEQIRFAQDKEGKIIGLTKKYDTKDKKVIDNIEEYFESKKAENAGNPEKLMSLIKKQNLFNRLNSVVQRNIPAQQPEAPLSSNQPHNTLPENLPPKINQPHSKMPPKLNDDQQNSAPHQAVDNEQPNDLQPEVFNKRGHFLPKPKDDFPRQRKADLPQDKVLPQVEVSPQAKERPLLKAQQTAAPRAPTPPAPRIPARPTMQPPQVAASPIAKPIASTGAQKVKLQQDSIQQLYSQKKIVRVETDFNKVVDTGGAANVGAAIYQSDSQAKIGIMIAGNHGVLGGALGKKYKSGHVAEEDLKLKTQEESIWANAVLNAVGTDSERQKKYYNEKLGGNVWGMKSNHGTETYQGIDYTKTKNAEDYNLSLNLEDCQLSRVDNQKHLTSEKYPVMLSFTAGPNANPKIGQATGTMQRTLNQEAIENYDFFRSCVKEALRSSLDGMAQAGVTHPLVALLSCGIYAGDHKDKINKDYHNILNEVLNEAVGPEGQKRGQYFIKVMMPTLS